MHLIQHIQRLYDPSPPPKADLASVYWSVENLDSQPPTPTSLPPQEILDEIRAELLTTWKNARSQDRVAQHTHRVRGWPSEPHAHIYCPIEGGDYIVDDVVRELARMLRGDVVVLDSAHIVAGKSGRYFSVGDLPKLPSGQNPIAGRKSRSLTPNLTRFHKAFFDKLVNFSDPHAPPASHPLPPCPRIIYIRDFPTLARLAPSWFSALEAAVSARNRCAETSAAANESATVIVFGSTPGPVFHEVLDRDYEGDGLELVSQRDERLKERLERVKRGLGHLDGDAPRLHIRSAGRLARIQSRAHGWLLTTITRRKPDIEDARGELDELGFSLTRVIMPESRASTRERETRIARRREINVLVMRMAIERAGGSLPEVEDEGGEMWYFWGRQLDSWQAMKRLANRVVSQIRRQLGQLSLVHKTPIMITWDDVQHVWVQNRGAKVAEKLLITGGVELDPVIEEVKADRSIDRATKEFFKCIIDRTAMHTTFEDVNLPLDTVDAVRTIVSLPLLYPDAFTHGVLRQHATSGCLLFGPPGTGKTMLVRALARDSGARMIALSPSEAYQMCAGDTEKGIHALFDLAGRLAPCILFIDEVDSMFCSRHSDSTNVSQACNGILAQFLQEMDGLSTRRRGVMVFGATNRPFDLDDAVLRRLPRRLFVDLPNADERESILRKLLKDETLAGDVDLRKIAEDTPNFSGSDLKHLAVAAALSAVKEAVRLPWKTAEDSFVEHQRSSHWPVNVEARQGEGRPQVESGELSAIVKKVWDAETTPIAPRVLHARHFDKALEEISASTSESAGTLAEIRQWNDLFGQGASHRRRNAPAWDEEDSIQDGLARDDEDDWDLLNSTLSGDDECSTVVE